MILHHSCQKQKYTSSIPEKNKTTKKLIGRLNKFLEESSAHLDVNLGKVTYRKFDATGVKADILLKQADIVLNNIKLNHAQGSLQVSGEIKPGQSSTPFNVNANIAHVNVEQLFYAFENFGQTAITDKNIKGSFSADVKVNGTLKNTGEIQPYSLNGYCDFHLINGALIHFEPIKNIGKFVFRRRDLSNISFKKIENKLLIKGNKIVINPMAIESSVLNLFLKGVYGITGGTDIEMEIPVRNPQKDELIEDKELKEKRSRKGIVLYLKAVDEDGKVKIKWNRDGKKITAE